MRMNGNILTADEGKILVNGDGVTGQEVALGKNDSPDNWKEILLSALVDENDPMEALKILGVSE